MMKFGGKKFGKVSILTRGRPEGGREARRRGEEGASWRRGGRAKPRRQPPALPLPPGPAPGPGPGALLWPDPWGPRAARMRSWSLNWCSGRRRRPPRWARGALGKVSAELGSGGVLVGAIAGQGLGTPILGLQG